LRQNPSAPDSQWTNWEERYKELYGSAPASSQPAPFPAPATSSGFNFGVNTNTSGFSFRDGAVSLSFGAKKAVPRKKSRKPKDTSKYHIPIYKILKQVHPDTGISKASMNILDDFIKDILVRILRECETLCLLNKKCTLTSREVQTAVRLCLPGELAKHSVSEGTKAVTKFTAGGAYDDGGGRRGRSSASHRAGLIFPVAKVKRQLKEKSFLKLHISKTAPVYLSAVLEYLVAEVLELSGNASRDNKKVRIIPRHIMLAMRNDEELNKLTKSCYIAGGGTLPMIFQMLLPKYPKAGKGPGVPEGEGETF